MVLYTDGAKNSAGVGAAFSIPSSQHQYRLTAENSIFTAELFAVLMALRWKFLSTHASPNFVICTDSSPALHKIQKIYSTYPLVRQIEDQHSILSTSGKRMHFFWVSSHQGLTGNETADSAAKGALTTPFATMVAQTPPSDAKSTIKDVLLLQWQNSWNNSTSTFRTIKPSLVKWITYKDTRKDSIVLARLRLGHTRLIYLEYLTQEDLSLCSQCQILSTVAHFPTGCSKFSHHRTRASLEGTLENILANTQTVEDKVICFLKAAQLYQLI